MPENITYQKFIQKILDSRGRFACGPCYHETHHIIPKCMGGNNDEQNLIDLFPREHFIAHKLLCEESPTNAKLIYAFWRMAARSDADGLDLYLTPEEYEQARIKFINLISGDGNPMYGKSHTDVARKAVGDAHRGKKLSADVKQKMSNTHKIQVAQYDTTGDLIHVWDCAKNAGETIGINQSSITQCCKFKLQTAGGFIWRYVNSDIIEQHINTEFLSNCFRKIIQYTKNGDFVREWNCWNDIVQNTGINGSHLTECLNNKRKSTGGFIWMYKQ